MQLNQKESDFVKELKEQEKLCIEKYRKAATAAVDGQLRTRTYETQDGQKRKAYEVVADNVRFLSPKDGGSAPSGATYGAASASEPSPFGGSSGDMVGDEDLPF